MGDGVIQGGQSASRTHASEDVVKRQTQATVTAKPPLQAIHRDHVQDKVLTLAGRGAAKTVHVLAEETKPFVGGLMVTGAIYTGLTAFKVVTPKVGVGRTIAYGGSIIGGDLTYKGVKSLTGNETAGKVAAIGTGVIIGLAETAILKDKSAWVNPVVNGLISYIGADVAADQQKAKR